MFSLSAMLVLSLFTDCWDFTGTRGRRGTRSYSYYAEEEYHRPPDTCMGYSSDGSGIMSNINDNIIKMIEGELALRMKHIRFSIPIAGVVANQHVEYVQDWGNTSRSKQEACPSVFSRYVSRPNGYGFWFFEPSDKPALYPPRHSHVPLSLSRLPRFSFPAPEWSYLP